MIDLRKKDSVAAAIEEILQQEALKGNQSEIDKNHNNRIDKEDFKILRGEKKEVKKEEVEQIEEALEELTPSKHGSFSVNSKVSATKQSFHKGQHVGMDTLVHKGTIQHKDNSKPSKFEVHNHINRGLTFQTHHSDEEKHAIKQHLIKNKMANKHTDITEEVEPIEELSKQTLKSYGKKAYADATQASANAHDKVTKHIDKTGKPPSSEKQVMKIAGKEIMHVAKRTQGLARAETRLAKEEVLADLGTTGYTVSSKVHQHPDEKHYNTNTLIHRGTINGKKFEAHSHINHGLSFKTKHNDAEQAAIKNHLKKNKYLSKNEEVEPIEELSKSTLGSYVKNAARDVGASRKLATDFEHNAKSARKQNMKDANKRLSDRFNATAMKRHAGIGKAVERLTKEEVDVKSPKTLRQFKEGWEEMMADVKKRAEPQPNGGSGVKQGSRYGGSKQKDKPEQDTDEKK